MEINKTMSKVKIVTIQMKSRVTGNTFPHMVKKHHKKWFDEADFGTVTEEYRKEIPVEFDIVMQVRKSE